MTPMQKKVELLAGQVNQLSKALIDQANAINNQAGMVQHHQNAIQNMMEWLAEELGVAAVQRLRERLDLPPLEVCEHDKLMDGPCLECGRIGDGS